MLIHRKNLYVTRGKWRPGRREVQSCGTGQQSKKSSLHKVSSGGAVILIMLAQLTLRKIK
jgi:hypothetical protein